jgi:competence protein ComGC
MGYSGMGYQKWISSQRPRKPFSRDRKPIGGKTDQATFSDFNLHEAEPKKKGFNVLSLLLILFIIGALIIIGTAWNNYVKEENKLNREKAVHAREYPAKQAKDVTIFMHRNAEVAIRKGDFEYAKQDLKIAQKHKPKNIKTSQLWALLYLTECNYGKNCDSASYYLDKHFTSFPNDTSTKMLSLKQAYEEEDFTKLAEILRQ